MRTQDSVDEFKGVDYGEIIIDCSTSLKHPIFERFTPFAFEKFETNEGTEVFFVSCSDHLLLFTDGSLHRIVKIIDMREKYTNSEGKTIIHDMLVIPYERRSHLLCCGNFGKIVFFSIRDLIDLKSNQFVTRAMGGSPPNGYLKRMFVLRRISSSKVGGVCLDGKVYIWNVEHGFSEECVLDFEKDELYCMHTWNHLLFTGGVKRVIRVYDMNNRYSHLGKYPLAHCYGIKTISSFQWNGEMFLMSGGYGGCIIIWKNIGDVSKVEKIFTHQIQKLTVSNIVFLENRTTTRNNHFFTTSEDGFCDLWKLDYKHLGFRKKRVRKNKKKKKRSSMMDEYIYIPEPKNKRKKTHGFVVKKLGVLGKGNKQVLLKWMDEHHTFGGGKKGGGGNEKVLVVGGTSSTFEGVKFHRIIDLNDQLAVGDLRERIEFLNWNAQHFLDGRVKVVYNDNQIFYFSKCLAWVVVDDVSCCRGSSSGSSSTDNENNNRQVVEEEDDIDYYI